MLIGLRDGQRVVRIVDDGEGFDEDAEGRGQGLRNIRSRAAAIGGAFRLVSRPGGMSGTSGIWHRGLPSTSGSWSRARS